MYKVIVTVRENDIQAFWVLTILIRLLVPFNSSVVEKNTCLHEWATCDDTCFSWKVIAILSLTEVHWCFMETAKALIILCIYAQSSLLSLAALHLKTWQVFSRHYALLWCCEREGDFDIIRTNNLIGLPPSAILSKILHNSVVLYINKRT